MKKALVALIVLSVSIIFIEFYFYCYIPDSLFMPIVGINAIVVTLILAFISYSQWQKTRLENEVLKEQLKLVIEFLNHMKDNPNRSTLIGSVKNDGIGYSKYIRFSIVNYNSLLELSSDKYITQQLKCHSEAPQWFNEMDNEIVFHPLFPIKLFNAINELDTASYIYKHDIPKKWFKENIIIQPEHQLLLMKKLNKDTEGNASFPLVFPYKDDHLKIKDIIIIYKKIDMELKNWFKLNHIDIELNIHT